MLLTKKIKKPELKNNLFSRSSLIDHLIRIDDRQIFVLNAPAGYGKTTLILQWLQSIRGRSAWYNIEKNDNQSAVFWHYLIHALKEWDPSIGKRALSLISSNLDSDQHELIIHLISDLEKFQKRFIFDEHVYIVLDDAHHITNSKLIEQLNFFIDHLPSKIRLIFSARSQPPIQLPKRVSRQQAYLVPKQSLLLSASEISSFFSYTKNWLITGKVLDSIYGMTQGWIGLLHLMVGMERPNSEVELGQIKSVCSHGELIREYFDQEVFSIMGNDEKEIFHFQLKFSRLPKNLLLLIFDAETLVRVSHHLLEMNLMVISEYGGEQYFEIDANLRESLRSIDSSSIDSKKSKVVERYFVEKGDFQGLFDFSIAQNKWNLAAKGASFILKELIRTGRYYLGNMYIKQFPESEIIKYPALKVFEIWTKLYVLGHDKVKCYRDDLELYIDKLSGSDEKNINQLGLIDKNHGESIRYLCQLTLFQIELLSSGKIDDDVKINQLYYFALQNLDFSQWSWNGLGANAFMQGKMRLAEDYLTKAISQSKEIGDVTCLLSSLGCLGPCLLFLGKAEEALRICHEIHMWCLENGYEVSGQFSIIHRVRLLIFREMNEADEANRHYQLLKACPRYIDPLNRIYHKWTEILYLLGVDNQACRKVLNELQTHYSKHYLDWNLGIPKPDLMHAILDVMDGNHNAIVNWSKLFQKQWRFIKSTEQQFTFELLVLCRVLIISNRNPEGPLRYLIDTAIEEGNVYIEIKAKLLLACYGLKGKKKAGYISLLKEVLVKSDKLNLNRTVLDEEEIYREVLTPPILLSITSDANLKSISIVESLIGKPKGIKSNKFDLTQREKEVMKYLLDGLSNDEVSSKLGISQTTVKTHVSNIYSKLHINSRMQLMKLAGEMKNVS